MYLIITFERNMQFAWNKRHLKADNLYFEIMKVLKSAFLGLTVWNGSTDSSCFPLF